MNGDLFIGLMSGTSADGIDAVLVQSDDASARLVATHHRPMSESLREDILASSLDYLRVGGASRFGSARHGYSLPW